MLAGPKIGYDCCFIDCGYTESRELIWSSRFSNLEEVADNILSLNTLVGVRKIDRFIPAKNQSICRWGRSSKYQRTCWKPYR